MTTSRPPAVSGQANSVSADRVSRAHPRRPQRAPTVLSEENRRARKGCGAPASAFSKKKFSEDDIPNPCYVPSESPRAKLLRAPSVHFLAPLTRTPLHPPQAVPLPRQRGRLKAARQLPVLISDSSSSASPLRFAPWQFAIGKGKLQGRLLAGTPEQNV